MNDSNQDFVSPSTCLCVGVHTYSYSKFVKFKIVVPTQRNSHFAVVSIVSGSGSQTAAKTTLCDGLIHVTNLSVKQ